MDNLSIIGSTTLTPGPSLSGARMNAYAGLNIDRRTRSDSRADRRWGNWGILEVPASLLWFDVLTVAAAVDDGLESPDPVIDIWP